MNTKNRDGGANLTQNNLEVLRSLIDVDIFAIRGNELGYFEKVCRLLFGMLGFSGAAYPWTWRKIKTKFEKKKYDLIFIDHSIYGQYARRIRRLVPGIKIVTHFHNIESVYQFKSVKAPWLVRSILSFSAKCNERDAVKYSDLLLCLTDTDSQLLNSLFGRSADFIIPLCMDIVDLDDVNFSSPLSQPYILFCGSKFAPNIQGINWFIEHVLPEIPYRLVVVGQGMKSAELNASDRVDIFGDVDDLRPFYMNAIGVISPIFVAGGMKTKVVDAMRYGRPILATSESLNGIDWAGVSDIYRCDKPKDFVKAILGLDKKQLQKPVDNILLLFREKYSTQRKMTFYKSLVVN